MNAPWPLVLEDLLATGPCVMVTIAEITGSAPRELGTRMLVTGDTFHGSVGGGNLELQALETARRLLAGNREAQEIEHIALGPALNQCCGGAVLLLYEYHHSSAVPWLSAVTAALHNEKPVPLLSAIDSPIPRKWLILAGQAVDLPPAAAGALAATDPKSGALTLDTAEGRYLFEVLPPPRLKLYLFGAGHVGKAVVQALNPLPFDIVWADRRRHEFPREASPNVTACLNGDPLAEVESANPGSLYLVMTHSHQLDEDICHAVLTRGDFRWLGLIGSRTKALRFRHRLAERGIPAALLERLECPVGLPVVNGKRPATIALSIAARLLAEQVPDGWK